jgi:ubiquinone/menaquinone biosynthesis C-methylase UbiE
MSDQRPRSDGWQLDDSAPEAYERYLVPDLFTPWADDLVNRMALQPGERVLDVGCGTGIVARRAAQQVGDDGEVVGIDLNEGMLDVARRSSAETDASIDWRRADATELPFDDGSFDAVLCQQVLQFIPHPDDALREMHRVLRPVGHLGVGVLRSLAFNPAYTVLVEALAAHVSDEAAGMMRSPFPAWDTSDLRTLVLESGFREVTISIEISSLRYPSVDEFLRREAASSPLSGPLESIDSDVIEALLADLETALEAYVDDHGIVFPLETHIAVATP